MRGLLTFFFAVFVSVIYAQITTSVIVSKDSITVGQPVEISFVMTDLSGQSFDLAYDFDSIPNLAFESDTIHFEEYLDYAFYRSDNVTNKVTKHKFRVSDMTSDSSVLRLDFSVSFFSLGSFALQPMKVTGARGDVVRSGPAIVHVYPPESLAQDTTGQLADIKTIVDAPITVRDVMPYVFWVGVLLILGLLIYLFSRRRKHNEVVEEMVVLSAKEKALSSLDELSNAGIWEQGNYKDFQVRFTSIVKEYLDETFQLQTLELPTSDSIKAISEVQELDSYREEISQMLQIADLIKFAKAKPAVDLGADFISKARVFINQTSVSDD